MSKSRTAMADAATADLLRLLAGESCPHCDEGTLEPATYKTNAAVVCDACGTPRVQVW